VIGAGASLAGGFGHVVLDDIVPNANLTQVGVTAWETQVGTDQGWGVSAYAICATPPPGLQRVSASSGSDRSRPHETVVAACPTGKKVLGLGASLSHGSGNDGDTTGGVGQVGFRVLMFGSDSAVLLDSAEDQDGTSRLWRTSAYAICATD
jgi:hypothetical protein